MKKLLIIIVAAMLVSSGAVAQLDKYSAQVVDIENKLDSFLTNDAKDNASGTGAIYDATVKIDKILNKVYKELLNKVTTDFKKKITQSQINWIKYKDYEDKFSNELYEYSYQSMWQQSHAYRKFRIIKERIDFLQHILDYRTTNEIP